MVRQILIVDAGTTAIRCHIYDNKCGIVTSIASPWVFADEKIKSEFTSSVDVDRTWNGIAKAISDCVNGRNIDAISITSQRQALVFLDSNGQEIYFGTNIDLRAIFEGSAMDEQSGPEIYEQTGHKPSFLLALGKLRWFQLHRPASYARISTILSIADWLVSKLTGELARERTLAAEAGMLNIWTRETTHDLYQFFDLQCDDIRLVDPGEVVGETQTEYAATAGLDSGIPVTVASADTQIGLIGMGVVNPSEVGLVAGWSAPIQMVTDQPILDPNGATWVGLHATPGKWVLESSAGDLGNTYTWIKNLFFDASVSAYGKLTSFAESAPVGSKSVRCYFGPERMNMAHLRMSHGGMMLPVPLVANDVGKQHIVRAALESFAFVIRSNLKQIENLTGEQVGQLVVGGGMSQATAFLRILTNVIGRPLKVAREPRVTVSGAALSAAIALGRYDNFCDAVTGTQSKFDIVEPKSNCVSEYEEVYEDWRDAGHKLASIII